MDEENASPDCDALSAEINNSTNNNTKESKSLEDLTSNNENRDNNGDLDKPNKSDVNEDKHCVTSNKEFKLRIVPLEKLLAKPSEKVEKTELKQESFERKAKYKSYKSVVISSSSESDYETNDKILRKSRRVISLPSVGQNKKTSQQKKSEQKTKILPKRNSRRPVIVLESTSCSEEEEKEEVNDNNKSVTTSKEKQEQKITNVVRSKRKKSFDSTTSNSVTSEKRNEKKIQITEQNNKIKRCVVRLQRFPLPLNTESSASSGSKEKIAKLNGHNKMSKPMTSLAKSSSSTATTTTMVKRKQISSDSDDSDFDVPKLDKLNDNNDYNSDQKSENSDAKSTDSEILPVRKKRVFNKKKNSSEADSDFEPQEKQPRGAKKRSRVKKHSSDDNSDGDENNKNKRKHIRKIIKTEDLDISTKNATKEEGERRKRIEERQKLYNQIYEKPENVEIEELILDFDEDSKKTLLEVDKGLLKQLKKHQVAGVKFMWESCFETLSDAIEKPGSGCILAHCMGLGKTLQVVTLAHTLLSNSKKTHVERVLIISPLSTLNNWAREFIYWMNFTKKKNVEIYDMSRYRDKATRIFKLNEWFEEGGVCILGYDMYRILANEKAKGLRKKQRDTLQKVLVQPGPDLVVCDEGHLLKNEKTSISKAVNKMCTKRRIVLTGTPLQNNLKEYYCMIQFIKPNLLGTYKEYLNRFVNPITNGQYTDSTDRDIRLMKHRSHILHKMLEGCMQRRDYAVLAPYLPSKYEYVVYTTLSELQQKLYEFYMTTQRDLSSSDIGGKGARLFQDFQDLRRIWTHPMNLRVNSDTVIRKRLLANDSDSMEDFIDDNEEEESASSSSESSAGSIKSFASGDGGSAKGGLKPARTRSNNVNGDSDMEEIAPIIQEKDDPSEWWKRFVEEKELNNINHSPKLVILMRLLVQCEAIGDKVLVFSQSLQSLDVIEHFLSLIDSKTKGYEIEGDVGDFKGNWKPGYDYFRLDGSCTVENREGMCKHFNDKNNLQARLFLISTRAGGLGINLVAANRVVIFDVSWNPSHDTQSIFRVYRFGQDKPCYIYRLIAMGTMEQKVYERQVAKQATAKRVIDEQQISRHYNQSDLQELYTYELSTTAEREVPILPKDRLFAELLSEHEKLLFKYHEHDSLLENEEGENLSEAERKAAWSEYEAEKTRSVQTASYISYDRTPFGGINPFGNTSGSVTSNKIFGFRSDVLLQLLNMKIVKDLPDLNQNQVLQLVPNYLQQLYTEMNNGDPTMYKDLLSLHATLVHPSGMYMNPLLYANQNPSAAGYYQASTAQQPQQPPQPAQPAQPEQQQQPSDEQQQPTSSSTAGFNPNEVYEID